MRSLKMRLAVALVALFAFGTVAEDVLALVGHPATPMSAAGVARRTVRRTAIVHNSTAH